MQKTRKYVVLPLIVLSMSLTFALGVLKIGLREVKSLDVLSEGQLLSQFAFLEPVYQSSAVSRSLSVPLSNEVILTPTTSTDQALFYSSIVNANGKVRLYYVCFDIDRTIVNLCIAEQSRDSGKFEKLFEDGVNIVKGVDIFDGAHVIYDESYGYILFYSTHDQDKDQWIHNIATSSDGIYFEDKFVDVIKYTSDSHNVMIFDPWKKKFVAYIRSWNILDLAGVDTQYRTVSRLEIGDTLQVPNIPVSENPLHNDYWPTDKRNVISQELDVIIMPDQNDPPNTHIYTPNVMTVPGVKNSFLALPSIYMHYPDPQKNGIRTNDGTIHLQYAFSSDGVNFQRGYRTLDFGGPYTGALQSFAANGLNVQGDFIYLYVVAMNNLHQDRQKSPRIIQSKFKHSEFTKVAADKNSVVEYEMGRFENSLRYNSLESKDAEIEFELLDSNRNIIPGFGREDFAARDLGDNWKLARWKNVTSLPEDHFSVRLYMSAGTEIYSYILSNDGK